MYKIIETEDGAIYVENEVPHFIDGVFIHWSIYNWSHSKVKYYKDLWNNFIVHRLIARWGNIYALPPTKKEEKLIKMFGFEDTGLTFRGYKLLKYTSRMY